MSMMVIALHCRSGQFAACGIEPVRAVLEPKLEPPGFAIGQPRRLQVGPDFGPYEIEIGGWDGLVDVVGGVTVFRADHYLPLWELLLRLSAKAQMVLMDDALGAIGCLAATRQIADQVPRDTLERFGMPLVTMDAEEALAVIAAQDGTSGARENDGLG